MQSWVVPWAVAVVQEQERKEGVCRKSPCSEKQVRAGVDWEVGQKGWAERQERKRMRLGNEGACGFYRYSRRATTHARTAKAPTASVSNDANRQASWAVAWMRWRYDGN